MNNQVTAYAQPLNESAEGVQKNLSRAVFDVLLERDLLGFLLSSKHFRLFLMKMEFEADAKELALAQVILTDATKINDFQQFMLRMYSGVYIEECRHADLDALMLDLDQKYAEMMMTSEELHDSEQEQINHVELAWRYRHFCSRSEQVNY